MKDEEQISRRTALKVIAIGVGAAGALPLLEETAAAQDHTGMAMTQAPPPAAPQFFNQQELATITTISELIIPADDHSPGATAAGVPNFIDEMVSVSSAEVKALWREGPVAINKLSQERFSTDFNGAGADRQISLLKSISKNEYRPRTIEERFFVAIKSMTVDGYYTSQIGIHQDLRYKGNAYLTEFKGCSHPEHLD